MSLTALSSIESQLGSGERLLWKGRPRPGIRLRGSDMVLIPFSLLWGGFAFFWEYVALFKIPKNDPLGWLFAAFGVPFVLAGFYIIIGRFFVDAKMREATEYAVTNRRAIIVTDLFGRKIRSINLPAAADIVLIEKPDRSGTISFGSAPYYGYGWRRHHWSPNTASQPVFEMIDDVRRVYDLIESVKQP